jgi:hypothetical protein
VIGRNSETSVSAFLMSLPAEFRLPSYYFLPAGFFLNFPEQADIYSYVALCQGSK